MRKLLIGLGTAAALAGCDKPLTAPLNAGVCWRLAENGPNGKPEFRPLAPGVANLEACAVMLEGLRLRSGLDVEGGFQGRHIYATANEVTVASGPTAQRYRVFTPQQLGKIRLGVQALIDRDSGR